MSYLRVCNIELLKTRSIYLNIPNLVNTKKIYGKPTMCQQTGQMFFFNCQAKDGPIFADLVVSIVVAPAWLKMFIELDLIS